MSDRNQPLSTLPKLFLASSSPRRKELLQQLGCTFEVVNAPIEEVALPNESPNSYVLRMAIEKALSGFNKVAGKAIWVVGSDTAVVLNGKVFGKPRNAADAFLMLSKLSGRAHEVLSAVAVVYDDEVFSAMSKTRVQFGVLTEEDIQAYIATEEPFGKAGSYAIQGEGAKFIEHIEGSYSGVMGLPLYELNQLLIEAGYLYKPA
ncbi:MAG: Maf family nucleotide pyrophosphatase [Thiomicrorhabdus sp.]|nr:Maf family nucleotide pyrophosphatase [Thiomicrorhabdus sp.]